MLAFYFPFIVTRLLSYAGRRLDHHARRTAAEAAADTAFAIFNEVCCFIFPSTHFNCHPRTDTEGETTFGLAPAPGLILVTDQAPRMVMLILTRTNSAFLIILANDPIPILATDPILVTVLILVLAPALVNKFCRSPHRDILVLYLLASHPATQERDPTHLMAVETWECQFTDHRIVHQL